MVSTFDRETSQVNSGVIDEKVCALAQYYAELDIEPPSKIEAEPQDFGMQVLAAIDAGVPVLSFIYGIPPSEILAECHKQKIKTIGLATTPKEAFALEQAGLRVHCGIQFRRGWPPRVISSLSCGVAHGRIFAYSASSRHCQTSRDSGGRDRRWARRLAAAFALGG